jgi:hypothetical protein
VLQSLRALPGKRPLSREVRLQETFGARALIADPGEEAGAGSTDRESALQFVFSRKRSSGVLTQEFRIAMTHRRIDGGDDSCVERILSGHTVVLVP